MPLHDTLTAPRRCGGLSGLRRSEPWRRRADTRVRCTAGPSSNRPQDDGAQQDASERDSTVGDALGRSLSELAKVSNRLTGTTNLLLTGETEDQWRKLDKKVNKYPIQRTFTAIGTGGQEFKAAMVAAVESVVGQVHCECINERHSSQRSYISVTVGPVWVENGDQIIEIYGKMKQDSRAKWII